MAIAALLPLSRVDAVLLAMQLSFVGYAAAVMWAFAARSATAAWKGIVIALLVSGAVAWVMLR